MNFLNSNSSLISRNSSILLLTTTHFRSMWKIPFDKHRTLEKANFYDFNGKLKMVPMMRQNDHIFDYYEDNINQVIELDYEFDEFSMGIVLPKQRSKLSLSHEIFEYYVSQLRPTHIRILYLPKFQQSSKFKIDNLFQKLGFNELFINGDFSEITPSNEHLYVSDIVHQSIVTIDESYNGKNVPRPNKTPTNAINFEANHPFIYYIRYKPTNTVVLSGYYT